MAAPTITRTTAEAPAPVVPKVRFYELQAERAVLDRFLEETEGEETPELAQLWEQLQGTAENKALNWAKYTKELALQGEMIVGMEAALKKELDKLASSRKAIEAKVVRSRTELSRQMQLFGLDAAKAPGVSIWHVPEKPVVVLPDISALAETPAVAAQLLAEGWARYTPPRVETIPEQWEWEASVIIERAKALAELEPTGTAGTTPTQLPPGVTVTFRKGIRVR